MALSANTTWEVRPGAGSSNNSGGFVAGASGTDFSQQNAAQYNAADLAGTNANTSSPSVSSASHSFIASDVGNLIHITAGTNWTAGYYQIVSVAAGAATLDRACASVASPTAGTYFVGGAAASIANVSAAMVAGNIVYQKGGTDTLAGVVSLTAGSIVAPTRWEGYVATRGDIRTASEASIHTAAGFLDTTQPGTWPVVALGTNVFQPGTNCLVVGIKFTGTKTTTSTQVNCGTNAAVYRCVFAMTGIGASSCITLSTRSFVRDCDFTHVGQAGQPAINAGSGVIKGCRITSTSGGGILLSSGGGDIAVMFCLFYSMAASQTAILNASANNNLMAINNTFDNIAGTCISVPALTQASPQIIVDNNQVTNCGTFLNNLQSGTQAIPFAGFVNRIRNTSTSYTGFFDNNASTGDITTAQTDANEYKNLAGQDYRLKDGAAGQGAGSPLFLDTGASQRKEPTLPTAAQVLNGIGFGDFGTEFTGTVVQPSTANVRNGTTFGASSGSTGTLVVPIVGNVRNGITFDNGSSGTLVVPAVGDVRLGTAFDTASTGTLRVPSANDVRNGTSFDVSSTGNLVVPTTSDVRSGTTFGSSSGLTGVLVLPVVGDVRTAVGFGANGTEFTGTLSASGGGGFILGG